MNRHRSPKKPKRDPFTLPYGVWRLADGSEILFDRGYFGLWRRKPGQPAEQIPAGSVGGFGRYVSHLESRFLHRGAAISIALHRELLAIEQDFIAGRLMPWQRPIKGRAQLRLIHCR